MKTILSSETMDIPDGVKIKVKAKIIKVVGPRGKLTHNFKHLNLDFQLLIDESTGKRQLKVDAWFGSRKTSASIRIALSQVDNLITGVTKGYRYKMRFVYAHFPINASITNGNKSIEIRNFLGEKKVRIVEVKDGSTVEEAKEEEDEAKIDEELHSTRRKEDKVHFPPEVVEEEKEKANYACRESEVDPTLRLAYKGEESRENNTWYLDTGASNHMYGKKTCFWSLNNILSLEQLLEKGYDIHFKDHSLSIRDQRENLIVKVPMTRNRMFELSIQNDVTKYLKACLKLLSKKKKMVKGLPPINHADQLCEGCLLGKHSRKRFPEEASTRAKKPLELVHSDVCGPIDPSSLDKSNYFVLFIDDFLGSDRGGEFTSKKFEKYCEENEIRRPLTVPYSPQQNGVAERKNRSILNMARCMLKSKRLPKELWTTGFLDWVLKKFRSW
ncbi:uncharacterized protein LOC111406611 [Olea europaea var. sylvestris]|uniref:uncharacterized protein LOC111406611 n=1 Tax=Olea europaea var. sylvestris TaxID=158386 RepID=UPI000C1D1BD4|nr:uncharacterized protein LOC111406611 [Olea europaea var. sylvestris]